MARGRIDLRGTIYHLMDARGIFQANPANVGAQDDSGANIYTGPVPYPKMLYHPDGELRVLSQGEKVKDVDGSVQVLGRQTEIIHKIVKNRKEEEELRKEGWHDHPAKAMQAAAEAGTYAGEVPPMSSGQRIEDLEAQIAVMQAELEAGRANAAGSGTGGKKAVA